MDRDHDERVELLQGGRRMWWDVTERKMVPAATVYIPFGCPDWGETNGVRNANCVFCAIPHSVTGYREAFYDGKEIPESDHITLFRQTLHAVVSGGGFHTLMVFNGGSFLAMPYSLQESVVREICRHAGISRLVIEARASLVTRETLLPILSILEGSGIRLTVRIGVETKDDHLRLKVLRKGCSRRQLLSSTALLRSLGVSSGGYVLLNPSPGLDPMFAEEEAQETIRWILDPKGGLGMDEVYFGPACVGPGTALAVAWGKGEFFPASLWSAYRVLTQVLATHAGRVHLLPFVDQPPFLAVPSNHVPKGIPESLAGAQGCDLLFHDMFQTYRKTMDAGCLHGVSCSCAP